MYFILIFGNGSLEDNLNMQLIESYKNIYDFIEIIKEEITKIKIKRLDIKINSFKKIFILKIFYISILRGSI